MRKVCKILFVFIFCFFAIFVTRVSAKIVNEQKGDVLVAKGEIINDDLFIGAQTTEVYGTVNGDVFIGAQSAKVNGIINGNLHVAAGSVDLGGIVNGNVYIGAGQVNVSGSKIRGSLLVGSGSLNVDESSTVGGSILAGTGTATINSPVARNMYLGAGSIYIDSVVGGEVRVGAGNISIGGDTKIAKDLYYSVDKDSGKISISDSATVAGAIHKNEYKFANQKNIVAARNKIPNVFKGVKVAASIITFIGALLVGFLYLKLFEKHFVRSADLVSKSFWKSLGVGFLIAFAAIPGFIILFITVVGIPVAGVAILLLLLYSYLAKIVVGEALGNWISKKFGWKMSSYGVFALGLFIIYIAKFIPFVGFLTTLAVLWAGLGALALHTFSKSN